MVNYILIKKCSLQSWINTIFRSNRENKEQVYNIRKIWYLVNPDIVGVFQKTNKTKPKQTTKTPPKPKKRTKTKKPNKVQKSMLGTYTTDPDIRSKKLSTSTWHSSGKDMGCWWHPTPRLMLQTVGPIEAVEGWSQDHSYPWSGQTKI